jgi:broad specificity phosphatase PhoE
VKQVPKGRIILVRHGETEANRLRYFAADNVSLTETGRLQAHELAMRLKREFRPDALISSEFLRAKQTSEIIGQVLGLDAETVSGLHERDFGCLKGKPYEELGQMMTFDGFHDPEVPQLKPWLWRPAGGESLDDVRARAIMAIEAVRCRQRGREVVVVCHGAVIQAVCAHITGEWSAVSVPPNCGIVTVEYGPAGWQAPALADCWERIVRS